ncbi:MAG TPA: hypothetical protein VF853_05875 [Candidatus Deferrimicrobiaceae bacterium]
MTARRTIVLLLGLLLAAGTPYLGATAAQADPGCGCHQEGKGHGGGCGHHAGCGCGQKTECGCGQKAQCGCEHSYPKDAGQAGADCPCGTHGAAAGEPGGMHAKMHGGKDAPPMKERMGKHLEAMKEKVRKLRELEAKMAGQGKDGEAFRASSLEHAKLLTDIQESHLKHMEGMMGGGK